MRRLTWSGTRCRSPALAMLERRRHTAMFTPQIPSTAFEAGPERPRAPGVLARRGRAPGRDPAGGFRCVGGRATSVLGSLHACWGWRRRPATELLALAEAHIDRSHDLYQFTSEINRSYSPEDKLRLLEELWRVAHADERRCTNTRNISSAGSRTCSTFAFRIHRGQAAQPAPGQSRHTGPLI